MRSLYHKFHTLLRYRAAFKNWPLAATLRYIRKWLPPQVTLVVKSGKKITLSLDADRAAYSELFVENSYKECLRLKHPALVWDVGGNIGCFVIWASDHFPEARFHSFEPTATTFERLQFNRNQNPDIHWEIYPYGLSSKDETCTAFVIGNSGETSRYGDHGSPITFQLRSAMGCWEEMGRPAIDLLKVDCEGGEYELLLRSPDEFLQSVGCLIMEVHLIAGFDPEELRQQLERSGFELEWPKTFPGMALAWRSKRLT